MRSQIISEIISWNDLRPFRVDIHETAKPPASPRRTSRIGSAGASPASPSRVPRRIPSMSTPRELMQQAVARHSAGDFSAAELLYRRVLAQLPHDPQLHSNLGILLAQTNRAADAIGHFRRAVELAPNWPVAHNNLGNFLTGSGDLDGAVASYRSAVALDANYLQAWLNLGQLLFRRSAFGESAGAFDRAAALDPNNANCWTALGTALLESGDARCVDALQNASRLAPGNADALYNLANALRFAGRVDEAIDTYRRAIEIQPQHALALTNLAATLKEQGRIADAIALYRRIVESHPDESRYHSNLLYMLWFDPDLKVPRIVAEHRAWNDRHAKPIRRSAPSWAPAIDRTKKLRVGYISPDLSEHVVGILMEPILQNHDRDAFESFCYSDVRKPDARTARLRAIGHNWRDMAGLDDARVAKLIEEDRIDVLVDLAQHMAGNRMLVFARRPAPVQVSYLGYPATTGLAEMDYRITDPYLDPPGAPDEAGIERLIHVPCYWCYVPPADCPPVNDLPAKQNGYVTLGCLNNFTKVNQSVLALWSKLLGQIPDARLLLHVHGGAGNNAHLAPLFKSLGVDPARIHLAPAGPRGQFISAYQQIDISLDPFPYGGGVTSMDALWMGVPLITLQGDRALSRAGACVLSHVGLTELIARDADRYIEIATGLAMDLDRLSDLRRSLRQRVNISVLMNPATLTRSLERAYVQATESVGQSII